MFMARFLDKQVWVINLHAPSAMDIYLHISSVKLPFPKDSDMRNPFLEGAIFFRGFTLRVNKDSWNIDPC